VVSPSARRRAAQYLVEGQKCSVNRACEALHLAKSTYYRKAVANRSARRLERRIKALSRKHATYGYRFITELLRIEGWQVNRKRVQRVRRKEELQVVRKTRKSRRVQGSGGQRVRAARPNEVWSYDFIHDRLENGVGLKMLTVLDEYTRECLGILVERSITATAVVGFLEVLMLQRGPPAHVRSDNGPEFVAEVLKGWMATAGVKANYIEPGSPWENGHVESFHGKLRGGCLNREVFGNLLEAKVLVEGWRRQYNDQRPHSALGYKTPRAFARQFNSKLRVATLPSALS
jgi:transposase InsO family protein